MAGRLSAIERVTAELIATAELTVETRGEGFVEITREAIRFVEDSGGRDGALFVYLRHTSASLTIQENADPDVQTDLTTGLRTLAPADAPWVHTVEGPDDMPAHVKGMLTGVSLHIPVRAGALALGTWQGLYLVEHRARPPPARNRAAIRRQQALAGRAMGGPNTLSFTPLHPEVVLTETLYRLVIADDHPLFRGALREAVSGLFETAEIGEAGAFDEVSKLLDKGGDVDLILLDLTMPGARGFSGLMYLRAQYPSVPVVVVSANDDPAVIRRCMSFGASGFIPKTLGIDEMRKAIMRVLKGGVWTPPDVDLEGGSDAEANELMARLATLTPQQVRVLMMLSEGLLNKQIAYELSVSEATVKAHVSAILQKLGVESRTQAVIAAAKIEVGQWPQPMAQGN